MMKMWQYMVLISAATALAALPGWASQPLEWDVSVCAEASSGDFAPYLMSSLRHGRVTQRRTLQTEGRICRRLDGNKRFDYGYGVDLVAGAASALPYELYMGDGQWGSRRERPSGGWVQELYAEVKYRSVLLSAGLRERGSALLNQELTSGDFVESGNARPIPQVRLGFADFVDIPLTGGALQIQGEVAYGRMMDDGWWRDHYNYYNYHLAQDNYYNYKRCFFRTRPEERLSVTVGMQAAAVFGGSCRWYDRGRVFKEDHYKSDFWTFVKMCIPTEDGGESDFYTGNHLGTWDLRARYRLRNEAEVTAYVQWPWEDGSGIGKLNGFDGMWGLEYKAPCRGWVSGALVEYLDFTNQSGPIHYAPADHPGSTVTVHASGADDYYNNTFYNSYAYFGQSIGTPALMAPIYNLDGYPAYAANAMRGFHVGVAGAVTDRIDYRLKGGYRKAWGSGKLLLREPIELTSVMAEVTWRPARIPGLTVRGSFEIDRGSMPCDAVGAMLTLTYSGSVKL